MPVMATSQSVEMEPVNNAVQKSCAFTVGQKFACFCFPTARVL